MLTVFQTKVGYYLFQAYPICSVDGWSFFIGLSIFGLSAAIVATITPWIAQKKLGWNPILIFAGKILCH